MKAIESLNAFIQELSNKGYIPNQKGIESIQQQVGNTIREIGDEGLIPIPTQDRAAYGLATTTKALLGPLGKPFRVARNEDMDLYLQGQIQRAKQKQQGNELSYGWSAGTYVPSGNIQDALASAAIGQWTGKVDNNGQVILNDDYNFNHKVQDYAKAALTGQGFGEDDISAKKRAFYAIAGLGKGLEKIGWLNQKPLGINYVAGNINDPSLLASR